MESAQSPGEAGVMERASRRRRAWGPLLLCLAFLGAASVFEEVSEPAGVREQYLVASTGPTQDRALMQAAGEFRIVAANLLWMKVVDHYHHQFMADGGNWAKNESLLPLLKTITELDPHFVEAYALMGGTILPATGKTERGREILSEGLRNNPRSWELYREMALLYAWREQDAKDALPYARAGLKYTDDEFSHNIMRRLCRTLESEAAQPAPVGKQSSSGKRPEKNRVREI